MIPLCFVCAHPEGAALLPTLFTSLHTSALVLSSCYSCVCSDTRLKRAQTKAQRLLGENRHNTRVKMYTYENRSSALSQILSTNSFGRPQRRSCAFGALAPRCNAPIAPGDGTALPMGCIFPGIPEESLCASNGSGFVRFVGKAAAHHIFHLIKCCMCVRVVMWSMAGSITISSYSWIVRFPLCNGF